MELKPLKKIREVHIIGNDIELTTMDENFIKNKVFYKVDEKSKPYQYLVSIADKANVEARIVRREEGLSTRWRMDMRTTSEGASLLSSINLRDNQTKIDGQTIEEFVNEINDMVEYCWHEDFVLREMKKEYEKHMKEQEQLLKIRIHLTF